MEKKKKKEKEEKEKKRNGDRHYRQKREYGSLQESHKSTLSINQNKSPQQLIHQIFTLQCSNSPLPPHRNLHPVTLPIRLLLHLGRERNRTHDAITKLLIDDGLVRIAIVLNNLIQPVDQRLLGRHVDQPAPIRERRSIPIIAVMSHIVRNAERVGQDLHVLRRRTDLFVKDARDRNLVAAQLTGELFERQAGKLLRLEQFTRKIGKARDQVRLLLSWLMDVSFLPFSLVLCFPQDRLEIAHL